MTSTRALRHHRAVRGRRTAPARPEHHAPQPTSPQPTRPQPTATADQEVPTDMRRAFAAVAVVACLTGLSGCGDEEPPPASGGEDLPTKTIDITVEGDELTPNGERVQVEVGQPIELVVQADAEGEIHVHSDPEQELSYGAGTTTLPTFTIDVPGVVEVESHALEKVIVQLEVE